MIRRRTFVVVYEDLDGARHEYAVLAVDSAMAKRLFVQQRGDAAYRRILGCYCAT